MSAPTDLQVTPEAAPAYCEHKRRLLYELADAIKWLNSVQYRKTQALLRGDVPEAERCDEVLAQARDLKQDAWNALLGHMTVHGCVENLAAHPNVISRTKT